MVIPIVMTPVFSNDQMKAEDSIINEQERKQWFGFTGSTGKQFQFASDREYTGYRNSQAGVFLEWETGSLIPLPVDTERTLRLEFRYAYLWGTIPLSDDQVPEEVREQEDSHSTALDHHQVSVLAIRRWIFLPTRIAQPYVLLGLGMSITHKRILEEGSIYAFNFSAGGGVDINLNKRWSLFTEVSLEHFSNGGEWGLTDDAVIGPESINGRLGLRYRYH
jgi:hypothetical protein